ncbi:uncharacterized protein LOC129225234 [Uloborus diversus]|uniref:uncharacterized protein LOC129225234 n=1 Tax=Uloborus diversus TaxID=327109 RepID=UPI0024093027|nr:uncharacterized protein LOC129225234 [Uloborus diversus]
MAKVMDQPLSEEASSDNEEINKLFPRCRPRNAVSNSDFNQNSVNLINNNIKDHRKLSTASSDSAMSSSIMDKANDNYLPHNNQDHQDILARPASDMSETSSCCGGDQQTPLPPPPPAEIAEDDSVISAYDYCDYDNSGLLCNSSSGPPKEEVRSNSTSSVTCDRRDYGEEVVYDPELDVGYHMDPGFCLRDSRIEIAGGREIFSKSRSKPSKKRHSDEVSYHRQRASHDHSQSSCNNNVGCTKSQDFKRFSADVMYDDKLRRYMYNMCSGSVDKLHTCAKYRTEASYILEEKSPEHMPRMNGRLSLRKSSSVRGLQDLPADCKQHTGHLVYEAPVSNAEVVYDDIGELIDQTKDNCSSNSSFTGNGSSNGLHVKTNVNETDYSTYPGEILESPNSDTDQSFRIMHKPHIDTLDASSPMSPCGGLWNIDGLGQDHTGSLHNLSQDEDMDTDSEPASPVKQGIARLIGNVPIAEYEGSPRRYGPRPGYPHRISSDEQNSAEKTHPSTCEELLKVIAGNGKPLSAEHRKSAYKSSEELTDCGNHESGGKNGLKDYDPITGVCSKNESKDSCTKVLAQDSDFSELDYRLYRVNTGSSYVGRRLAQSSAAENEDSPKRNDVVKLVNGDVPHVSKSSLLSSECLSPSRDPEISLSPSDDAGASTCISTSTGVVYLPNEQELMLLHESVHQHTLQVEMVDQDLESISTYPGTEDLGETEVGEQVDHTRNFTLSPETTDCDSNDVESVVSLEGSMNSGGRLMSSMPVLEDGLSSGHSSDPDTSEDEGSDGAWSENRKRASDDIDNHTLALINKQISKIEQDFCKRPSNSIVPPEKMNHHEVAEYLWRHSCNNQHLELQDVDLSYFDALSQKPSDSSPRLQADNGLPEDCANGKAPASANVSEAIKEIKHAIQMTKNVQLKSTHSGNNCDGPNQPVWVPRLSQSNKSKDGCHVDGHGERNAEDEDCDTDQETDRLLGAQRTDDKGFYDDKTRNSSSGKKKSTSKEVFLHEPAVLIEGVLFRARYLGSTQLVCEGQPTKATRMMQAEEAVSRIKAPEGETQPSTEVDLFISTEKIMVLNTDLKEIMMDHALRAISYIADIGDLVVLMARRRVMNSPDDPTEPKIKRTPKMICHVFESEEAQFIAQSIGQAFQVAYMEFLKANGIEDSSFVKEMDYQEVLNSQEIFGNELEMFAKKEKQKEVVVPKQKGEILGMVIVESGWGSMLPTVVIANMAQSGPAARCGQLNIGDQIIAINGISLVGLPLSTCQNYIKNTKNQTVVKLTVVPCAPVVEVKIKRPDTKYQLGFSVQNGVICSLLRGGIAERGGVRVGHRIIEINGQSVVAVPHEKIVNLLATSVGEIHMKTMPTSMFRLLTGQESPLYI